MDKCKLTSITPQVKKGGPIFESGLFGVNAEITRKGFFGGLSAQMLNNRKLYMGNDGVDGWECINFQRVVDRSEESLCGSSFIILKDGGSMSQTSSVIALKSGEQYEAKVWVKSITEKADITFGIKGLENTLTVSADGAQYHELSFVFKGVDIINGTFCVNVSGEVAIYELSLMPSNNFYGMRWDVIEHMRTIAPTSIRFPGGCAADHFDWKESLKAPEFRKPADGRSKDWFLFRDTYHQDPLDIGLNEFIMLCRELNAEPEYTVSLILSDGEDAAKLIEYCNGAPDSEYGAIREALGFEAFNIHLWYVGNEAYFFGGEYEDSKKAAERTDELITAMKRVDPSIAVAIGLTWGINYREWAFDFMKNLKSEYEYVSYHDYIGILPDANQGDNGMATLEILENNFIDGRCFGLDFYRDNLFADNFDKARICVDEWNYSWGKDSSNALFFSNALQFHFLAKSKETYHIDRAEFFMPVNEGMITVKGSVCKIESTGEMFRLMAEHKGGRVIECEADGEALDILCTDHGEYLYISVINRSGVSYELNINGYDITECVEIKIGDYSFESNDFEVTKTEKPVLYGHSLIFIKAFSAD